MYGMTDTVALRLCQDGTDGFLSTQPDCEGKQLVRFGSRRRQTVDRSLGSSSPPSG
jgi:hypothetical protein